MAAPHQKIGESPSTPDERDFVNWGRELFRLVATNERFTFVRHPGVEPTNNVSERELRGPALCRKTGRTNKTPLGAHRQSAITSVLRSLPKHLPTFTLSGVMSEVLSWPQPGSFTPSRTTDFQTVDGSDEQEVRCTVCKYALKSNPSR